MKKFILRIILFSSVPMLVIISLEMIIFISKDNLLSEKSLSFYYQNSANQYDWVNAVEADSIIVLSGSSSVRYGLSCSILNDLSESKFRYVNIAMDARDPIETYFILKNIDLSRVSELYFGIDPWIYTKTYYKNRQRFLFLDFSLIEAISYFLEHDNSTLLKRYVGLFVGIIKLDFRKVDIVSKPPKDFGSVALERSPTNFNTNIQNLFQLNKYGWSDLQFEYLKKISDLCIQKKIKFALFLPPKRSDFSMAYISSGKDIHDSFIVKMMEEKINDSIFGKFNQFDENFDSEYFSEAFHLNKVGQEKYSILFKTLSNGTKERFSSQYQWFEK